MVPGWKRANTILSVTGSHHGSYVALLSRLNTETQINVKGTRNVTVKISCNNNTWRILQSSPCFNAKPPTQLFRQCNLWDILWDKIVFIMYSRKRWSSSSSSSRISKRDLICCRNRGSTLLSLGPRRLSIEPVSQAKIMCSRWPRLVEFMSKSELKIAQMVTA